MGVISLARLLSAEEERIAEREEDARRQTELLLPRGELDEKSPCCGASINYSLGVGNPYCSECGNRVYS